MRLNLAGFYLKRIALGLVCGQLSLALRVAGAEPPAALALGVFALLVGTVLACWSEARS